MKLYAYKYYKSPGGKGHWGFINSDSPDSVVNYALYSILPSGQVCEPFIIGDFDPAIPCVSDFYDENNITWP